MLQHSDPMLRQYEQSLPGDPVKDKKVYEAASPIAFIHNVKAPLLLLQGDNDPRVPKEEAEQVVDLLKKDGKPVEAHYYAHEGHGFEKREKPDRLVSPGTRMARQVFLKQGITSPGVRTSGGCETTRRISSLTLDLISP